MVKKYIKPDIDFFKYDTEDTLLNSGGEVKKNGKYNVEFNYEDWNDDII